MVRNFVYYGHPDLRKKSAPIQEINADIRQIAEDLIETLLEKNGAGLAAPQIGSSVRMFVSRYENGADSQGAPILCPPKIYINPILSNPSQELDTQKEGSFSIPEIYKPVRRPWAIDVEAVDLERHRFSERATGWRARNLMHQNDSLNGVLFIDRLDPKIRKKIEPTLRLLRKIKRTA